MKISRFSVVSVALLAFLSGTSVTARELTTEERLADFAELQRVLQRSYGPYEFKRSLFGRQIDRATRKMPRRIRRARSDAEFGGLMTEYLARFSDTHLRLSLGYAGRLGLPVSIDFREGQFLVSALHDQAFAQKSKISVGDRIERIEGRKPVDYLEEKIWPTVPSGLLQAGPRNRYIARFFSSSFNRNLAPLPSGGKVTFKISGRDVEMNWAQLSAPRGLKSICSGGAILRQDDFMASILDVASPTGTGTKKIGCISMQTFAAPYLPGKTYDEARTILIADYDAILTRFEKETDGLILDFRDHSGGDPDLAFGLLQGLISKPRPSTELRSPFKPEDIARAVDSADTWLTAGTPEYAYFQKFIQFLKNTWASSQAALSDFWPIYALGEEVPPKSLYSKKSVLLTGPFTASGAEIFAANYQGWAVGKVFGEATNGAGGFAMNYGTGIGNSQFQLSITKSLFYTLDRHEVENRGILPDVSYSPKIADLQDEEASLLGRIATLL